MAVRGMTIWFKRAKSFVAEVDGGTKKFLAQQSNTPVHQVPFWVADTKTFKQGVKDESIVNLTPPHLMPGYAPPAPVAAPKKGAKAVTPVEEPADDETELQEGEDTEPEEQTAVPQAPFGGQQLVPNTPAAGLGLRGGKKK